ncbi:MAG: DUF6683 family protein [Capsulimonas sp.]|uniref:DUF6683 family protein n=1 Tax=Capsulimonas sp. TaxID=2494211 RepID=UPI00326742D5
MRNGTLRKLSALVALSIVTSTPANIKPVAAQGVFDMGAMTNTLSMDHVTQSERSRAKALSRSMRSQFTKPASGPRRATRVSTTFHPSAAVRKRNYAQFVAKTRAVDPKSAADLQHAFATQDIIGQLGREMARYDLRTNDVADAMTVYLIIAWYGVRGRDEDPPKPQVAAVRRQMANAIKSTPQFASATDAQKQEMAEAMLIHAVLAGQAVAAAKAKPEHMTSVKAAIAQGATTAFGFDLRRMKLTDKGLQL